MSEKEKGEFSKTAEGHCEGKGGLTSEKIGGIHVLAFLVCLRRGDAGKEKTALTLTEKVSEKWSAEEKGGPILQFVSLAKECRIEGRPGGQKGEGIWSCHPFERGKKAGGSDGEIASCKPYPKIIHKKTEGKIC